MKQSMKHFLSRSHQTLQRTLQQQRQQQQYRQMAGGWWWWKKKQREQEEQEQHIQSQPAFISSGQSAGNQTGPSRAEGKANKAGRILDEAKSLFDQGKLQESEVLFQRLVASGTHAADGFYGLGVIRLREGKLDRATDCFRNCIAQNPQYANAFYQLGAIAEKKGSIKEAHLLYATVLSMRPDHPYALQRVQQLRGREVGSGAGIKNNKAQIPAYLAESIAAEHKRGSIVGVAHGLQVRQEYMRTLIPAAFKTTIYVWTFRLIRYDPAGNPIPPPIQVEMRGRSIQGGMIRDGDWVAMRAKLYRGEALRTRKVQNLSAAALIEALGHPIWRW